MAIEETLKTLGELIEKYNGNGVRKSGSCAWKEILLSSEHQYQVLDSWNHDGLNAPMEKHVHEKSTGIFVITAGTMSITTFEDSVPTIHTLNIGETFTVPINVPHMISMTKDARCVIVLIPAESAYIT